MSAIAPCPRPIAGPVSIVDLQRQICEAIADGLDAGATDVVEAAAARLSFSLAEYTHEQLTHLVEATLREAGRLPAKLKQLGCNKQALILASIR